MRTTYYQNRRGGHCPGHVRDAFLAALEAYRDWNEGEPEPHVEFEVNYQPTLIPISKAAKQVWNCSDILPSLAWQDVEFAGLEAKRQTYASVARAMVAAI